MDKESQTKIIRKILDNGNVGYGENDFSQKKWHKIFIFQS